MSEGDDSIRVRKHVRWYISFALGAFFGAVVFLCLYGGKILDVTYEDWLLTGWYDLSQHYVGWKLYRASAWHFPIGLCDNSFYPYLASVIYTDSIPLWSFIFKILSPILPETFQFFGIYGLFCFMMQGGVAKLLLRRVLATEEECCIACIPFVFCAPLWQRMYYHTALASHYLILTGILLFLYRDRIKRTLNRVLLWCLLGVLCITTHVTIYAIVSVLLLGFGLWEALDTAGKVSGDSDKSRILKRLRSFGIRLFTYLAPYLAVTVSVFYLFGGFYGGISGVSDGLGSYSANLNSLFNPIDYSRIIKEFPLIECQYEGLSYIGIMAMIMLIPAIGYIYIKRKELWKNHRNFIISVIVTSLILWVVALSPKVTFNSHILFEIPVSGFIYDAWSAFRASGRFLWPVMYATILVAICFSKKWLKKYFAYILIFGCLLQVFEFSEKIITISEEYADTCEAVFEADVLEQYDFSGIRHVQFMHDYYFGEFYCDEVRDQMIGYTQFALRHGMTVSNFHFSRDDMKKLRGYIEECDRKLRAGTPDEDTMYVFRKEDIDLDHIELIYHNVRYIYTPNEVILICDSV